MKSWIPVALAVALLAGVARAGDRAAAAIAVVDGVLRAARGDRRGALAHYERAIALDPDFAPAYHRRGELRNEMRDYDLAAADFTRALALDATLVASFRGRALARQLGGDTKGALRDYTRAIALEPQAARAWFERGLARRVTADLEGADDDLSRAIELDPAFALAFTHRAAVRALQGDEDDALADYDRALGLDEDDAYAYLERGVLRERRGDLEGALDDWTRAIELRPSRALAWVRRAGLRERVGDREGALSDCTRVIELAPSASAYARRGRLQWGSRRFAEAVDDLQKALGLDPREDYARFFLYLAQALSPDGEAAARAALAAGLAGRGRPIPRDSWTAHVARFLLGEISAEALRSRAEASPKEDRRGHQCEAHFYAGMAAWIRGDAKGAVTLLERCLSTKREDFIEHWAAVAVLDWPR
jgi:tetratricopeptide (TPR) repeat protein